MWTQGDGRETPGEAVSQISEDGQTPAAVRMAHLRECLAKRRSPRWSSSVHPMFFAPASALRHYHPRHVGYGNTCGPTRHGDNDCGDVSCGGVRPAASGRTDESRALRRRGRGISHLRRRRGARDARPAVVPDASRLRPGGLGLPGRHLPLRRVEQRRLQLHRLGRRTTGRPARHHGLRRRRRRCTTPARSACVAALASHPHHWRRTRTISARGVQRSERGIRPRHQRRRRRGCRSASARLARCRCLRASGSSPALEPRGRRRHSRQRTDCILTRGSWRSEGLPLRGRRLVG